MLFFQRDLFVCISAGSHTALLYNPCAVPYCPKYAVDAGEHPLLRLGEPRFVVVMLAMIAVNWALALLAEAQGDKYRRMILVTAVAVNISLLFVFKYLTFVLENTNRFLGLSIHVPSITLPIGISFFYLSSNVLCDRCLPRGWQGAKKYLECDALYCVFSAADCRANRALFGFCRPNQLPNGKL